MSITEFLETYGGTVIIEYTLLDKKSNTIGVKKIEVTSMFERMTSKGEIVFNIPIHEGDVLIPTKDEEFEDYLENSYLVIDDVDDLTRLTHFMPAFVNRVANPTKITNELVQMVKDKQITIKLIK